jgi:hypothetical protein
LNVNHFGTVDDKELKSTQMDDIQWPAEFHEYGQIIAYNIYD